jgi:enoyl-CoA hydratase
MTDKDVVVKKDGKVASIILNKPQVKNAMGKQTLLGILDALDTIEKDPGIAVVIITGAGDTFCSGMDTRELAGPTAEGGDEFTKISDKVFLRIEKFNKIIIAVVKGYCMAGGFEIAMGCDFIIADEKCRIGDGHIKLAGFVPNGGASNRLPKLIGIKKAKLILYTGDLISGKEAEKMGIVDFAVPADEVNATTEMLVSKLTDKSPIGLAYMKKLIHAGSMCTFEEGLELEHDMVKLLATTEDHREARKAFEEKRQPVFQGK